jgi:hypothetical protein
MSEIPGYNPEQQEVTESMLDSAISEATEEIKNQDKNPVNDVLARTDQLGFFAAVGEAMKPHNKNFAKISFIDLKAAASGVLALIPLLGEGQAATIIGGNIRELRGVNVKDLYDAARLEGASAVRASIEIGKIVPALTIESITAIRAAQHAPAEGVAHADKALKEVNKAQDAVKKAEKALEKVQKKAQPVLDKASKISETDPAVQSAKAVLAVEKVNLSIAKTAEQLEKAIKEGYDAKSALEAAQRIARTQLTDSQYKVFTEAFNANEPIEKALHYALNGFYSKDKTFFTKGLNTGKNFVKHNFGKVLETIDPTPDVPQAITLSMWGAELCGLHGAGVVPAAWQLAKNRVDWVKESYGMGKDVGTVIYDRTKKKIAELKEPKIAIALDAFA